ncbi:hypothetical protein [Lysobacter gummosus]|uniref:hypothetical protein n=1 Tax=Lysobacter gummosus TaxID=262324 RepID=UPI003634D2AA
MTFLRRRRQVSARRSLGGASASACAAGHLLQPFREAVAGRDQVCTTTMAMENVN